MTDGGKSPQTARELADCALIRARGNPDLALMDMAALLLGCRGLLQAEALDRAKWQEKYLQAIQ